MNPAADTAAICESFGYEAFMVQRGEKISRKARALLIYLGITGRPHRRDRLCTVRRLAANPEKAHTREAPRTSTTNGMPTAMLAHIPSVAQGRTRMP